MLREEGYQLRALEPQDLNWLYSVENDAALWPLGWSKWPLSRAVLKSYLETQSGSLFQDGQLRLVYCLTSDSSVPIGIVDLFDYDPIAQKAGVGITVHAQRRGMGHGKRMLGLLLAYCTEVLNLDNLYAHVPVTNVASQRVFEEYKFETVGVLKHWIKRNQRFEDATLVQKLL